ncbi:MAG TPA: hypothetical protein VGU23_03330 [Acidobacteriaceae bacterium]|nr:hypothetical protein [Acidobacteriaceae bacterium]
MAFSLEVDGFCLVEAVLTKTEVDGLIHYLQTATEIRQGHGGIRNLLDLPAMRELVESSSVRRWVDQFLGVKARAVRGILFDKTDRANWKRIRRAS